MQSETHAATGLRGIDHGSTERVHDGFEPRDVSVNDANHTQDVPSTDQLPMKNEMSSSTVPTVR